MMDQFLKQFPEYKEKLKKEQDEGHGYFRDENLRQKLFRQLQLMAVQRSQKAQMRQKAARDEEM